MARRLAVPRAGDAVRRPARPLHPVALLRLVQLPGAPHLATPGQGPGRHHDQAGRRAKRVGHRPTDPQDPHRPGPTAAGRRRGPGHRGPRPLRRRTRERHPRHGQRRPPRRHAAPDPRQRHLVPRRPPADNVYVADASLFPESLGNPPILTIVAMAKRIGRLLAGEVPSGQPAAAA
ncbi:MAG TPA: GMC oxidoreductase [Actinomycetota bacterium]|nr:GMC oxidoreductase [Actinomycetota bacterium]